jgi:NAD(P)-dependent dehydrogenase (short-subunit alcohol dehydrogenase family)
MSAGGTVLITGANRGIGLGLTRCFVARGWRVFAACRRPREATELARLSEAHGDACEVLALEVTDGASVAALADMLRQRNEALDVLVNNAGINPDPRELPISAVPIENVADAFDVNVLGALRVLQAAVPALKRGTHPRVVNISSGAGSLTKNSASPVRPVPAYCISKAALNMLTCRAARDLPGFTVVSISPGWIKTDMGGPGAELELDAAVAALASTIQNLQPRHNGQWLDRFGESSAYAW